MKAVQAPAAALRSGRHPEHPTVVVSDDGVRYAGGTREEQVYAEYGVLWELWGGPFAGTPSYGELDAEVQREAADRLLCAYCMEQPTRAPGEGMLWLLRADADDRPWPADIETTTPPICRAHAELALERCAALRRGYVAVRVHEVERIGVMGVVYDQGGPGEPEVVLFTDRRISHVLGRFLVIRLRGAVPDPALHPEGGPRCTR